MEKKKFELTATHKRKIQGFIKKYPLATFYYLDLLEEMGLKKDEIIYVELLEYFTDWIIEKFDGEDKLYGNLKTVINYVKTLLGWIHEDGLEIKDDTLDKIRNFGEFYNEYLNKTRFDKDLELADKFIGTVLNLVNELYPCEELSESAAKYISQIEALKKQIKALEKVLADYDKLKSECDGKTDTIISLKREIGELRSKLHNKETQFDKLESTFRDLEKKIEELGKELAQVSAYETRCRELTDKTNRLEAIISAHDSERQEASSLSIKHSEIEELICRRILSEGASVDEILKFVTKRGYSSDRNEILGLLKEIRSKINVETIGFCGQPIYKIVAPRVPEKLNHPIIIQPGCDCYDILLVADFHIKEFNDTVLNGLDMLYDYCVKNNVHLILNLGDFYHGFTHRHVTYNDLVTNYRCIEEAISKIPSASDVYHAILGGNHDVKLIRYGFDPIKLLSEEREDIIYLGYTHATLLLNYMNKAIGKIGLFHPNNYNFPINFDAKRANISALNEFLDNLYLNRGKNRSDYDLTVLGHAHKAQFVGSSDCYYTPEFFGKKGGACHLRIYVGDNGIEHMVLKHLSLKGKLVPGTTIVHQRVLKP